MKKISMNRQVQIKWLLGLLLLVVLATGCQQGAAEIAVTEPTATPVDANPTAAPAPTRDRDFVVIATDAPLPPFTRFDEFGNVEGFDSAVMENIAAIAGFEYEFVVTPHQGVLDILAAGNSNDFDAVMSSLLVPETAQEGIVYTEPYLEVGQVMLVLANEDELQSYEDIRPGMAVGVQHGSYGEQTALEIVQISEDDLFNEYEKADQVVQALLDETVRAVIIDSHSADYFAESFPQQLKISGGEEGESWISRKSYGIAIAANDSELLKKLNDAIAQMKADQVIKRLTVAWLILDDFPAGGIDPGESRVGTPAGEFFIGVIGQLEDMDPASLSSDFVNWEIMNNSMSGLYRFNADNELQPMLAEGMPLISEDKVEYTVRLKQGLLFPDGSDFTAEAVRWSVIRASRLGNFLVNGTLKDANEDNFADSDAVQVLDPFTVKFILQEPTAYFPSLLATPPYFPISDECYVETADPGSSCGGLGPYTIANWAGGDRIRLEANPQWPGRPAPAFENIIVRFYGDAAGMRKSLAEFQSIDLAWTGLPYSDFLELQNQDVDGDGNVDIKPWDGPSTFKSYLIFEQETPPWNSKQVRQAVSYAIDRNAIVEDVFGGSRIPLLSPIPDEVPGHVATLPATDHEKVRSLMLEAGYTPENPLEITIWFVNDGRYSAQEEQYLTALSEQLEATGVFLVSISGAPWDQFRVQISQCGYAAYLLGWPSPGRPVDYLDPSSWTDFFVQNTDRVFCSNYESAEMDKLLLASREERDVALRADIYTQIQALWADELPTLDITQEPRRALSLAKVDNVGIDALGLLHYELLTKGGG